MGDSSSKNGHFYGPDLSSLESVSLRIAAAEEKNALILQLLREAAQRSRNAKSQPFYSIRAVANHFAVPPTTVSRIYARLKDEGLLASVWGSKTFVEPDQIDKQLRFRAVVGLPASLKLFSTIPAYRAFFLSAHDALWTLGFAPRLVFYDSREVEDSAFADLLSSHKIDVVVWFLPSLRCKNTAASLVDRGIRLITVVDSLRNVNQPCYYLSRQRALREGIIAWQQDGITSVNVVHKASCESFDKLELIEASLRDVGMHYTLVNISSCTDPFRVLCRQKSKAFIFPSSKLGTELDSQDFARFGNLFERHRVMLLEGLVELPACNSLDAKVDVVEFDWHLVGKRIASDLLGPVRTTRDNPFTFEATWLSNLRTSGRKSIKSANHFSH